MVVANTVLILPSRSRERQWRLWRGMPKLSIVVMLATLAGLWVVTQVEVIAAAFHFTPLPHADWLWSAAGGLAMLLLFEMIKLPPRSNSLHR
jgi:amino acid transporter